MYEQILKILETTISARTAAKIVLGGLVALAALFWVYPLLSTAITPTGAPAGVTVTLSGVVIILLVAVALALASLVVEGFVSVGRKAHEWRSSSVRRTRHGEEAKARLTELAKVLPYLPPSQIDLLRECRRDSVVVVHYFDTEAKSLVDGGWIEPVNTIDDSSAAFRLVPTVRPSVDAFFDEEREVVLKGLDENCRKFLSLYTVQEGSDTKSTDCPNPRGAAVLLERHHVVDCHSDGRSWRVTLRPEAAELVQEVVGTPLQRDSVRIGLPPSGAEPVPE